MTDDVKAIFDAGYESFDSLTTRIWAPVSRATVELSRPAPGERVLDACCGAGASAIPAAEAVGSGGRVDGVDLSERLLDLGRSRALGMPQLSFHYGDVMTWDSGPYDLVQCVLGIFLLPDPAVGATALAGRLRAGGRCAMTVWRQGATKAIQDAFVRALGTEGVTPAPSRAARVNTPEALTELLSGAGLSDVRIHEVPQSMTLDPAMAWDFILGSGVRRSLSGLDADTVERIRQRFHADWSADAVDLSVLVGLGRKPGF